MSKDTGGPAFPRDHVADGHNGMTLRDYFAAKVMQGLCISFPEDGNPDKWSFEYLAKVSYVAADAMIAERNK